MQSPHRGATMTDPGITCRKQCNLHLSGLKLSVKQFVFSKSSSFMEEKNPAAPAQRAWFLLQDWF